MGVFLSDYTNFQITNRNLKTGQTGALVNADAATLYGFEAQAQLAAAGFQADVSVAAMKSRIDNATVVDESPGLVPTGPAPMPQCVPATGGGYRRAWRMLELRVSERHRQHDVIRAELDVHRRRST